MSYRDDHEAALRRIADLERRLEAERAEHAADEGRVAELEKELAALRRVTAPKPANPAEKPPKPAKPPKRDQPSKSDRTSIFAAIPLLFVLGVMGTMIFLGVRGCVRGRYDGSEWLALATESARKWAPDAELMRLEGSLVDPQGKTDATYGGRWQFAFRSQSRAVLPRPAEPPPPVPGAPRPKAPPWPGCVYTCTASHWRKGGWHFDCDESRPSAECGKSQATPVRCSIKQVWQRASALGAPDPALANITLLPGGSMWVWQFSVLDRARDRQTPLFATALADDCSGP